MQQPPRVTKWSVNGIAVSANIDVLFAKGDLTAGDRIRRSAAAGFTEVEMWGWRDKDLPDLRRALATTQTNLRLLVCDPLCPIATEPDPFLDAVRASVAIAAELSCPKVIVVSGPADGIGARTRHQRFVDTLAFAAEVAAPLHVTLLLEAISVREGLERPAIATTPGMLDVVERVAHPALRANYDFFHSASMGERPWEVLAGRLGLVGHIQLGDHPDRHEPGSGDINWPRALEWLRANRYTGTYGLEFHPKRGTEQSLQAVERLLGLH